VAAPLLTKPKNAWASCATGLVAVGLPESSTAKEQQANAARAAFLGDALRRIGPPFAAGLAETDIQGRTQVMAPERIASNFTRAKNVVPSRLETVGGVRVGILGVADPALASGLGATAEDPVAAARREAAALRAKGAEIVVALAPVEKPLARRLAREAAVDLVVLGRQVGKGMERAERVGNAFLVERVFVWPGISRYGVEVILRKDLDAIVGTVLIIAAAFLIVNIVVDLLVSLINPQIRLATRRA